MEKFKPILSVLIPTRKRFNELVDCMDSFVKTASNNKNVEFILKFDTDDVFSWNKIGQLRTDYNIKMLVTDRLNGYLSLHEFANYMYPFATGEWLMFSNDDIKMMTNDWDLILDKEPKEFKCLNPYLFSQSVTPTLPIVNLNSLKLLGLYSGNHAVDRWNQYIYSNSNLTKEIPLTFHHLCLNDELVDDRKNAAFTDNWHETKELRDTLVKKLIEKTTFIDGDGLSIRIIYWKI